jgi:hypothetical protein
MRKIMTRLFAAAMAILYMTAPSFSAEFPKAGATCPTLAKSGVWTWYHDPRAVYYKNTAEKTYVGYFATGTNPGKPAIVSYDHATGKIDSFFLKTNFGWDDHNTTTVLVLPSGKIMTFYSQHYASSWFCRTTTNPEDITSWGTEKEVKVACTYPNVCQLSAENNRLYMFFRGPSTTGGDAGMPYYQTSDDGGATWTTAVKYFFGGTEAAGMRPYCKYVSNGKDKIYMLIEGDNRNNPPPKPTYFMYYYNGGFYKMNGTLIKTVAQDAATPIGVNDVEKVYDPDNGPDGLTGKIGTGWDVALDSDGYPVFVYDIFDNGGANHRLYYYRWDGTKWNHYFLVNSGSPMTEGGAEPGFAAGICLDHADPNVVYLSTHVGTSIELQRWVTSDKGKSWKYWDITSGSGTYKNCRPIVPRGTPGGKIDVVWNCGQYASFATAPITMDVKYFTFDESKMSPAKTVITTVKEPRANRLTNKNGLLVTPEGFYLSSAAGSTLRAFSLDGKLAADLTGATRSLPSGGGLLSYRTLGLGQGVYMVHLTNASQTIVKKVVVTK